MSFKEAGASKRSKDRIGGCVEIAEQRTDIARKRLAKQRAEEWGGDRKSKKKGGNGRQPSGNAILSDLFFQHGLLSILIVMAQGAGLMVAGAIGGLARLVSATGATVATVSRETVPLPTPSPIVASESAKARPRRRAPTTETAGSQGSGMSGTIDVKAQWERSDPYALLARHIMHDLSPPESRLIGTYGLTRGVEPAAAKFLFGSSASMSDPDMRALKDKLTALHKGGLSYDAAMKACMADLNGMAAKDEASKADFPQAGTENNGDGPGANPARAKPGDGDDGLPKPKLF